MRLKNMFKLKIKWMLFWLVFIGMSCSASLLIVNSLITTNFQKNQETLEKVILPLEKHLGVLEENLEEFAKIRDSIAETAMTKEEFENKKKDPKKEFDTNLAKLGGTDVSRTAKAKIKVLGVSFGQYIEKLDLLFETVESKYRLEKSFKTQIVNMLDGVRDDLRRNAEALTEEIDLEIEKYLGPGKRTGDYSSEVTDFLQSEWTNLRKSRDGLRDATKAITDFVDEIASAIERRQIAGISTGKFDNAVENAQVSLEKIKLGTGSKEILGLIEKIGNGLKRLKQALASGNSTMAGLQNQWKTIDEKIRSENGSLDGIEEEIQNNFKSLGNVAENERKMNEEKTKTAGRLSELIRLVAFVLIVFLGIAGFLIYRRIIIPINKLIQFADTLSKGDLTAEIEMDQDDEIGKLVSKLCLMSKNLNALIGQVQRSGIQITSSATELTATSKQQEAVMKTQLESTNYVVKSIGEISNVSEELVETMTKVAAMSDQTADFASSGQNDLAQMEEAMRHMENASKSISEKLEAINEKAANITSVVTTITKVADQTDLLSLNAAIEAEKAGESGRGFTVVAREIRRLADQTAVATLDIDQMVKEMQSAVSAGVMEMDAFITEVHRSAESVGKISKQLTRIIEQVQALSPSFEGVNDSMQIQSGNAQQINNSMVNLSEEMQQTVQSLRESFLAIEQLNSAAKGLQDEVSRFRVVM